MNLTFKRKLVLLYFLLVPLSFFAAEPFRDWKNQNSKLKPIEAQLLEYSEAFDRRNFLNIIRIGWGKRVLMVIFYLE